MPEACSPLRTQLRCWLSVSALLAESYLQSVVCWTVAKWAGSLRVTWAVSFEVLVVVFAVSAAIFAVCAAALKWKGRRARNRVSVELIP